MSAPDAVTPRVTLYGRPECHLCDEARDALLAMRAEGIRFELAEVDIESDDALLRAHLERIPVVEVDGEEASTLAFDAAAVRSALADMALAVQRRANTERVKDAGSEACSRHASDRGRRHAKVCSRRCVARVVTVSA